MLQEKENKKLKCVSKKQASLGLELINSVKKQKKFQMKKNLKLTIIKDIYYCNKYK